MKILLVDDHTLVRKGLIHLLASVLSDAHVDEAENADDAMEKLRAAKYDVALVDIRLPGRDGLDLLKEIRSEWTDVPVIILSSYDNGEYVKTALADGAAGYLLKDTTPDDLVQAITVAMSGSGNVLSPRAVRNMFDVTSAAPQVREEPAHSDAGLTKRESDVLQLLAKGCSNREISRQLFLSEKTVKAHLAAVFRKLGVTNRTQAAMVAVTKGLGGPVSAGAH
ncbi:MAG: response regulator transcription factor [Actinomycetota bacterium]|nr:response regulator transcription factor [Actinomycetota bacterium]